jgi:two-component system sensor histidine kinase SenX3
MTVPGGHQPEADGRRVSGAEDAEPSLPAKQLRRLVSGLPSGLVVLTETGEVALANPAARQMGVVRPAALDEGGHHVVVPPVRDLVERTRSAGRGLEAQLDLPPVPPPPLTRPRPDQEALAVRARTRLLGSSGHIAVILDDVTEARRVEAVRRDFVANVSHELKTPVGALHVLAEAVSAASEDPVAVRRFADRMMHESARLARLVQEIIDLSRLQGADPMPEQRTVSIAKVLVEAVDRTRLAAQIRGISVAVIGQAEVSVLGDESQLVTAVANLLDNAVSYSPQGTRVVLGVRCASDTVEISVADEGIGIAEKDLERVFERFYRADPARSRVTGGTGLGLAIVKHIATNHGGWISVWSSEGAGSTFTMRLPLLGEPRTAGRGARPETSIDDEPTGELASIDLLTADPDDDADPDLAAADPDFDVTTAFAAYAVAASAVDATVRRDARPPGSGGADTEAANDGPAHPGQAGDDSAGDDPAGDSPASQTAPRRAAPVAGFGGARRRTAGQTDHPTTGVHAESVRAGRDDQSKGA